MKRLFLGAGLLLVLVACSATINSLWINRETGSRRWVVNNPVLSSDIRVLDVREEENDGALIVNVLLKNGWHQPLLLFRLTAVSTTRRVPDLSSADWR